MVYTGNNNRQLKYLCLKPTNWFDEDVSCGNSDFEQIVIQSFSVVAFSVADAKFWNLL